MKARIRTYIPTHRKTMYINDWVRKPIAILERQEKQRRGNKRKFFILTPLPGEAETI
jgi:hypothetical protein